MTVLNTYCHLAELLTGNSYLHLFNLLTHSTRYVGLYAIGKSWPCIFQCNTERCYWWFSSLKFPEYLILYKKLIWCMKKDLTLQIWIPQIQGKTHQLWPFYYTPQINIWHILIWSSDVVVVQHRNKCTNKFISFLVLPNSVQYLVSAQMIISLPSKGMKWIWLWTGLWSASGPAVCLCGWDVYWGFLPGPVGSHLVWMTTATRVPLASAIPPMAAWSHVACSVRLRSTPVSMTDCGRGKRISGEKEAEHNNDECSCGYNYDR